MMWTDRKIRHGEAAVKCYWAAAAWKFCFLLRNLSKEHPRTSDFFWFSLTCLLSLNVQYKYVFATIAKYNGSFQEGGESKLKLWFNHLFKVWARSCTLLDVALVLSAISVMRCRCRSRAHPFIAARTGSSISAQTHKFGVEMLQASITRA